MNFIVRPSQPCMLCKAIILLLYRQFSFKITKKVLPITTFFLEKGSLIGLVILTRYSVDVSVDVDKDTHERIGMYRHFTYEIRIVWYKIMLTNCLARTNFIRADRRRHFVIT